MKPVLSPEIALRVMRAAAHRNTPARLRHWVDDIQQEALVDYVVTVRRGFPVTGRMAYLMVFNAIRRLFGWTRIRLDDPLVHVPIVDDPEAEERRWLFQRVSERWPTLTSRQQDALYLWLIGKADGRRGARVEGLRKLRGEPSMQGKHPNSRSGAHGRGGHRG